MDHARSGLALLVAVSLAACGSKPDSGTEAPAADAGMVAESVSNVVEASAATHPLCQLATFADVQAVVGGTISKLDVIDEDGLTSIKCVYIDQGNYTSGMSIGFVTNDKLAKAAGKWSTAADYFAEWSRNGDAVGGIGEGAAWVELADALYVLKGDKVVELSASSMERADLAARAKVESLAQIVVGRLP